MGDVSRRGFVSSAAMMSLAAMGSGESDDFAFKNNVPDPLLSGKELPTFKFELEKSAGKVIGNSYGKEATVEQLPISKGLAGVSMRLEPGAMRELHWHATAAEWAFVIEGRCRTTVIDPHGNSETDDFEPGDIWYFPRGHGHIDPMPGQATVSFHSDIRQRLFLGVWHVQHYRLDGAHARRRVWRRILACPNRRSTASRRTRFISRVVPSPQMCSNRHCKDRCARRRPRTNSACSRKSLIRSTRAAANGGSAPIASPSRKPSPA